MKKIRRRIRKFVSILIFIFSGVLIGTYYYINKNFSNVSFEQLIYSLFYSEGTSINAIMDGLVVGSTIVLFF